MYYEKRYVSTILAYGQKSLRLSECVCMYIKVQVHTWAFCVLLEDRDQCEGLSLDLGL